MGMEDVCGFAPASIDDSSHPPVTAFTKGSPGRGPTAEGDCHAQACRCQYGKASSRRKTARPGKDHEVLRAAVTSRTLLNQ